MLPLYGERLACTAYGQINFPFLSASAQKKKKETVQMLSCLDIRWRRVFKTGSKSPTRPTNNRCL